MKRTVPPVACRGAEVDGRLPAVGADLEQRAVADGLERRLVEGEALVGRHEALGGFGFFSERRVHGPTVCGRVRTGDEVDSLATALASLGLGGVDIDVLADHPGRRRVVRAGDVVVKAFSSAEQAAWRREAAGLRAVTGRPWAPVVAGIGERWSATRWIDDVVVPMDADVGNVAVHRALGPALATLHAVPPNRLAPWSVVHRLRGFLASPPPTCPASLARSVGRFVEPLLPLVVGGSFVHGDWGSANVLVRRDALTDVVAIIDFEDAHKGDPAEDLKWQVLPGVACEELLAIEPAYVAAGGELGPHAVERLAVAGAELCLDVLGWSNLSPPVAERFHGRCLATLDELVTGEWPAWPS